MQIQNRDLRVFSELSRWRFLTSKQVRQLCGFKGQRSCDRRLAKLIEANYITRKHYIYGIPRIYAVTPKAFRTFSLAFFTPHIRTEQIPHDIATINTAIYLICHEGIDSASITTERELKHKAGFSNPKHMPDFIYEKDGKTYCVEVELTEKAKATLEKNIKVNYMAYDVVRYFAPAKSKVAENVRRIGQKYGVEIVPIEGVMEYVRNI